MERRCVILVLLMEWIRILFLINGVFRIWVFILTLLAMILLSLFFFFLCQWD